MHSENELMHTVLFMVQAYLEGLQHFVEGVPVRAFAIPCTQIYWSHQVGEVHVAGQHKPLPGLGQILHTQQSFAHALRSTGDTKQVRCMALVSTNPSRALARSCIHNKHSPMHPYICSFIHLSNLFWFVCWVCGEFVWFCICLFVCWLIRACMHLVVHALTVMYS